MPPRILVLACLGIVLTSCALSSPAQVAKNDDFDPQQLDEYHLHRLDGTQSCAKVRVCNDAVPTNSTEVARLGVTPDYESWPEGAIP